MFTTYIGSLCTAGLATLMQWFFCSLSRLTLGNYFYFFWRHLFVRYGFKLEYSLLIKTKSASQTGMLFVNIFQLIFSSLCISMAHSVEDRRSSCHVWDKKNIKYTAGRWIITTILIVRCLNIRVEGALLGRMDISKHCKTTCKQGDCISDNLH